MTFARDPAVLRVGAALGDRKVGRALVRALLSAAPRAMPWIDARDLLVTSMQDGKGLDAEAVHAALVEARILAEGEGGIVLSEGGETLRQMMLQEREADRERQVRHRAARSRVTSCDEAVTFCDEVRDFSLQGASDSGTFCDGEGVASPITRAPGARGNLPPPTPTATTSDASSRSAANTSNSSNTSAPAYTGDTYDIPNLDAWLQATLSHHGFTGPSRLTSSQRSELLDAIRAGVSPDAIDGMLDDASSNGARKMTYVRRPLRRAIEQAAVAEAESRAPPPAGRRGTSDPIPLEEARLIREHRAGEPPGGMYEW